jgi:hypothetical protein
MKLKNSISLIWHGIHLFASLPRKRPILWVYLLCFGIYDIFYALYASASPSEMVASQMLVNLFFGTIIQSVIPVMSVFVLLILNGNQLIFAGQTWRLVSRTWRAQLVAGIYIFFGYFCMIVPGIILTLRYLYIFEAIVVEDLGIGAALARSRKLSAANGGRTFWALIIVFLAWYIGMWLCGVAVSFVSGDAALNTFAFIYVKQILGQAGGILYLFCTYSGYLDARALEADKYAGPSASFQSGQELSADRILGKTYAESLSSCSAKSLQQRQSLLRDLLGDNLTLWPPLRHLIEHQGFVTMLQSQSPASRIAARDALLQELDGHYLPHVMERVRAFMGGLLER